MATIEIGADNNVIEFAGRGFVSSDPDAVNIVNSADATGLEVLEDSPILEVPDNTVSLQVVDNRVGVTEIGRVGPAGANGADGLSGDELLLTKTERQDSVENVPAAGDITVYYGTAPIGTLESSAAWLVSRKIFTKDGGVFDSAKLFASATEDQIWDDHLILTYS